MNDLERAVGRVLQVGVAMSAAALIAGFIAAGVAGAGGVSTHLLTFGVLVLIGTPVARVALSVVSYTRSRDWTFAVLTLIVLAELVASILAAVKP